MDIYFFLEGVAYLIAIVAILLFARSAYRMRGGIMAKGGVMILTALIFFALAALNDDIGTYADAENVHAVSDGLTDVAFLLMAATAYVVDRKMFPPKK
ncbi:hypothetical protein M0Q28_02810 [Patescibacteria group bacterium]|jgi:hypothetical protein|nr:hypothetical protein [Patescibacteria group bacterium]